MPASVGARNHRCQESTIVSRRVSVTGPVCGSTASDDAVQANARLISYQDEYEVLARIQERASQQMFSLALHPCSDRKLRNSSRCEPSVKEWRRKLPKLDRPQLQFRKSLNKIPSHATPRWSARSPQPSAASQPLTVNNDRRVVGVLMDSWVLRLLRRAICG